MTEKETLVFTAENREAVLQNNRIQNMHREGWKVTAMHELASFWATFIQAEEQQMEVQFLVQLERGVESASSHKH